MDKNVPCDDFADEWALKRFRCAVLAVLESVREVTKGKPKLDIPSHRELILPQKVIMAIAVGRVLSIIASA
jgi:uncharacterized metal-binding protein